MADWKKIIVSGSTADLAGLTLSGAVNAGTDTDKFLVLDSSGNVDFRTCLLYTSPSPRDRG